MNRKKWTLLIFILLLVIVYFKLFYKTYSNKVVAKSADSIIAIDVKRIINTSIFNFITTPSQWKIKDIFKKSNKELSWQDMVTLPDYVLFFHIKNQPINIWYVVLQIKDANDFEKNLQQYQFIKLNDSQFVSKANGLQFYKNGNSILVTNDANENNHYLQQTAFELFTDKQYVDSKSLTKLINAKSHIALYIKANNFLQEDAIAFANFDKNKIKLEGSFLPNSKYPFAENNFSYNDTALCAFGCTQPSNNLLALWSDSDKNKISSLIGLNVDSSILKSNKYYCLTIAEIKTKTDSAITYNYDDNFNKTANVVVNKIQEPVYNFSIAGDSVKSIYNNWLATKKINETDTGTIFTPMPLVKSYCKFDSAGKLNICAYNYLQQNNNAVATCILFFNLNIEKIPDNLIKYLPDVVIKSMANFKLINLTANNKNGNIIIKSVFFKKDNDLPIMNF